MSPLYQRATPASKRTLFHYLCKITKKKWNQQINNLKCLLIQVILNFFKLDSLLHGLF